MRFTPPVVTDVWKMKPCGISDQWEQLKETITEIKENNKYDHDDVSKICGFLLNYMSILEKETRK